MFDIAKVHIDDQPVIVRLAVGEPQVRDIGLLLSDQGAYPAQHPGIVGNCDFKANGMHRGVAARVPVQIDPAAGLFFEFLKGGAVDGMHHDALAAIGDADDAFAGHGLAAGRAAEGLVIRQADDRAGAVHLIGLGADEFAVFLARANQDEAKRVLQRLIRNLGQATFPISEGSPQLSCSVGVVEVTAEALDVNWLMSAADSACYAAKQAGRNRVHCFNENRLALEERRLEAERLQGVSRAMAENRMLLYAQRIAKVGDPSYLHYEVLVRMRDSDGVLHLPGQFMPAVERYGMAVVLDRHVLGLLFRHLQVCPAHVRQLGLCNVNVSAQSIAEPGFLAFVCDLLERNRALASKLCFEITETAAIGNLSQARAFIDAVKARGCRVALDDFGSGLSSFGYLRQLPADMLKIDGAFVRDMDTDPVSRASVRAIKSVEPPGGNGTTSETVLSGQAMALEMQTADNKALSIFFIIVPLNFTNVSSNRRRIEQHQGIVQFPMLRPSFLAAGHF